MPDGNVGGGHQNDWKKEGTIYESPGDIGNPKKFTKGNVTENTNRNDNECWTAGTPVTWNGDDVSNAETITEPVAGIPDMLVTRDAYKITEYHPLITFFNEIMARIMLDGHKDWLSGLEKKDNAIKLWQYLEKEYLTPCENGKPNGAKKIVVAKKRKSVKKSKPVKKRKAAKKSKLAKKK